MDQQEVLEEYEVFEIYSKIKWCAPTHKVRLCMSPTPIHDWNLLKQFIPYDSSSSGNPLQIKYEISIKRDDMTGSVLSGNKVRKLEFLLADAIQRGCKSVISCGGIQSNHARTTALAAIQLGLEPHMFLRAKPPDNNEANENYLNDVAPAVGNVYLHRLVGTHVHLVPPQKYLTGLLPKMKQLGDEIEMKSGAPAYLIPIGGSNSVGLFGYLEGWRELYEVDKVTEKFDDVVVAVGSGGTASGLAIGNYLSGQKVKVHAVAVCDNDEYFYDHCDEMLSELGLSETTKARDILDVIDGYQGNGYAKSTTEELELLRNIARTTGILLDPVYTLKAVRGLLHELAQNETQGEPTRRFQGNRILFVHTGGIFGLFDMRMTPLLHDAPISVWSSTSREE